MTIKERVDRELDALRPQLTRLEWVSLRNVLELSLTRIISADLVVADPAVAACCGRCECHDNACPVHGIAATRQEHSTLDSSKSL